MKKSELWAKYVEKNPSFAGDGKVTLSAAGLRKLFNQTWDIAFYDGEDDEPRTIHNSNSVDDLMKIFGMK